eukprot:TRINITY_DN3153_c0_g1_i2.p1 TRINITY_DN3153_c0_g1~~TRINITY_DN3153_c0_g1_i2.p1  ORF type:complete len:505 (+),score=82.34 TRINITY_DN3153_c0_g1_i2:563-2077(+)
MHSTDKKFGEGKHRLEIDEEDARKKTYLKGIIALPRLRQWWAEDPETGELILKRQDEERSATWTELFYDLIFVATISKLAHHLGLHPETVFNFCLFYTAIFNVWMSTMLYASRFERDDWIHRLFYVAQMFGVVSIGLNVDLAYDHGTFAFGVSFIIANIPVIIMYIFAMFTEKRTTATRSAVFFNVISLIPWIVSIILDDHYFLLWTIGLGFSQFSWLIAPLISKIFPSTVAPITIEHWVERQGLFIIIVLGESIVSLLSASADVEIPIQIYIAALLELTVAFGLKWIYFDVDGSPKKLHALRRSKLTGVLWSLLHWPLSIFITASASGSIGIQETITNRYIDGPAIDSDVHKRAIFSSSDDYTSGNSTDSLNQFGLTTAETSEWVYCFSTAAALWTMSIIALLSIESRNLIHQYIRIPMRMIVGILIFLIPFNNFLEIPFLSEFGILSTVTLLILALSCFEIISVLASKEDVHEKHHDVFQSNHTGGQRFMKTDSFRMLDNIS